MCKKKGLFIMVALFLLSGCFSGRVPSPETRQYSLEYAPAPMERKVATDDVIRVERFTAAQEYSGREMIYRSKPFVREAYRYHRWSASPIDMVQGLLSRDLRQNGLFRAVLSYEEARSARYVLEGKVEEFLGTFEADRPVALLLVGITLVETNQARAAEKIVFQKTYRVSEPLEADLKPSALARGMSDAMGRLSQAVMADLQSAITGRSR